MPNQHSLEATETGELIQAVDTGRAAADPFKLPTALRTLVDTRLGDLKTKDAATLTSAGDVAGASAKVRAALDLLTAQLRQGHDFIQGVYGISDADRLMVFTSYGWAGGLIGELTDDRVESLANQAAAYVPPNAAWQYPAALRADIAAQLVIVNANQPAATGGGSEAATEARNAALDLTDLANSRARFFYCQASDDTDQTPELSKIGFQPRRDRGEAEPPALPAAPGVATFNAATLALSVPAMPAHASSLRAFRQPAGGAAVMCGTSLTTTVSVVGIGALTPGVTYELWVVGHNAQGDGPESNHVTHTST